MTDHITEAARRACPCCRGIDTFHDCAAIEREMHGLVEPLVARIESLERAQDIRVVAIQSAVRRAEEAERARDDAYAAADQFQVSIASFERLRDRLAAEVAAMREVVKIVDGSYQWLQIGGAETLVLALDRYRALKREERPTEEERDAADHS